MKPTRSPEGSDIAPSLEVPDSKPPPSGLAHVATVSFLASRVSPTAGFWIALAGGVALARAGARWGARWGYGAAIASMLETVAIMGPARFGVPFTQALTAPLLGALEARDASVRAQVLACAVIRLVQNAVFVAFFALVLAGGLDSYTDTYDSIASRLSLPEGTSAALIATGASLVVWAAFASTVQVLVYRRGLLRWPEGGSPLPVEALPLEHTSDSPRTFDPRAVAAAAAVAFVLLVASTAGALLAGVAAWLIVAWIVARADRDVVPAGAFIALTLGAGVLAFTLIGGLSADAALRRALRAVLLVAVATWLRAAAGSNGMRQVSRRTLTRLRRLPAFAEGAILLDELGSNRELGRAARSVTDTLRSLPERRPVAVLDAVLGWVVAESARFPDCGGVRLPELSVRAHDFAIVALAFAPAVALL
jgi:hypothetical protein